MKKFYTENYNSEQLKSIIKMNKLLDESYKDFINKKNGNLYLEKKVNEKNKNDFFREIYKRIDDMYNLSSFISENKIMEIIIKCDGDEEKIQLEIEKII